MAHYWLCSDKQKKMEATDVATKCLPKKCEHLRLKNREHFDVPKIMGLEDALEYISDDEYVEVTPKNIRIRKIHLKEVDAKRAEREASGVKFDY